MEDVQNFTLLVLAIILFAGLFLPEIFKKFRIPLVTPLLLLGSILGPFGFAFVEPNEIMTFLGFLGLSFLMLMAGLETNVREIKKAEKPISEMALLNGGIPFLVGVVVSRMFGYDWIVALVVGAIFISSSIGIIIPSIMGANIVKKKAERMIIAAVVLEDVMSLLLLAFVLRTFNNLSSLSLPLYFLVLVTTFFSLKIVIPKLANLFLSQKLFKRKDQYEEQLRFVILVFIAVLLLFSFLGIHPILAAFLVGLLLSETVTHEKIYQKLHTLSYGLFVPVFFFVVGMQMDLTILFSIDAKNAFVVTLIITLIGSKVISGYLGGKLAGLSTRSSGVFGILSTMQLTTALAITYSASAAGIIDSTITTAIVFIAVMTTLFVPPLLRVFGTK